MTTTRFGMTRFEMTHAFLMAGALCAAAFLPQTARAALGEPESSAADDAAQLQGSVKATPHATYRVHEITLPSGTVLREFAVTGGNVFAVAWSGPSMPNLKQALGRYFDVYVTAAAARRGGRRPLQILKDEFVMQSGGHMRAFSGRAFLATQVPGGTSVEELR